MKQSNKVLWGLFDKFNADDSMYFDVLYPIKKELERFLSSRQKTPDITDIKIASDYGVPEIIWSKIITDKFKAQKILSKRIHDIDPRCSVISCDIDYSQNELKIVLSVDVQIPYKRAAIKFIVDTQK